MRKVVVLPQPEGPSRQTTSPAATSRSTWSTAVRSPKTLVSLSSAIVDIASPLDRAEGDAAQEMMLQQERHDDDGHEEQRLDRRQQAPAHADVAADGLGHGDRHRARFDAREQQGEQELVPGEDEAEDGSGGQAGLHLWQADAEEDAPFRAAVHARG